MSVTSMLPAVTSDRRLRSWVPPRSDHDLPRMLADLPRRIAALPRSAVTTGHVARQRSRGFPRAPGALPGLRTCGARSCRMNSGLCAACRGFLAHTRLSFGFSTTFLSFFHTTTPQISQNFRESSWAYIQLRFSDTLLTTLHRYISQIQIHFATLTHFPHTTPRMNPHCDLGSTLRVLRL